MSTDAMAHWVFDKTQAASLLRYLVMVIEALYVESHILWTGILCTATTANTDILQHVDEYAIVGHQSCRIRRAGASSVRWK